MSRLSRITLITAGLIVLVLIIGLIVSRFTDGNNSNTNGELTPEQINQQKLDVILGSQYEQLLFLERAQGDGEAVATSLYVSDFVTTDTALLDDDFSIYYSNFLPGNESWFSIEDGVLYKHTFSGQEEMARTGHAVANTGVNSQYRSLAASPNGQYVAWITSGKDKDLVIIYNLNDYTENVAYEAQDFGRYTNLTWSPDSTELAFTDQTHTVLTITPQGAQLYNGFSIPFTEFNHLAWIESDRFAAVATSSDAHPDPFDPKIIVFNRSGEVIEEHDVFDRAGIPLVLWSPDAKYFMFYDQWKNYFITQDRFGKIQQYVFVEPKGKLIPLGWTTGTSSANVPFSITPTNTSTVSIEDALTQSLATPFSITADQWDQYNATIRGVVKLFDTDVSSYRFGTTAQGIDISVALLPKAKQPEADFIQIILQVMALLPDVPSITFQMQYNETDQLSVTQIKPANLATALDTFTTVPLDQLFVVNTKNPFGKPRPKSENPNHTYFGDLVYSVAGNYNPTPLLATFGVKKNNSTYFSHANISIVYPNTWQYHDLGETVGEPYREGDLLFFTDETLFSSQSSWSGFSLTIRNYGVPEGITLQDWLFVNRNDRTTEDVLFPVQGGSEVKRVLMDNEYSREYVIFANGQVYVVHIEHPPTLTPEDIAAVETLVGSFSDNTLLHR